MTHRSFRGRVLATIIAATTVPALGLASLAVPSVASAADKVDCKVNAVHLTKEGDGTIPANLQFIREQLEDDQFAAYKGFRLLESRPIKLVGPAPGSATLKTGHKIELKFLGRDQRKLKLHATLHARVGDKKLMSTDYTIEDKGVIMVGGMKYKAGKLMFAIQCASRG